MLLQVRSKVRQEQNSFLCKLIHLTAISFSKKKRKEKKTITTTKTQIRTTLHIWSLLQAINH